MTNSMVPKYIVKTLLRAFGALPLKVHYANSAFLAWLARDVIRYRCDVVTDNLTKSFPDKTEDEIKSLHKKFYRHFADIIVEAVWFGGCRNPERLKKSGIVQIKNPEELYRLYGVSPSVMVLYSHCGNWELYGGLEFYSDMGLPFEEDDICVVYKEMSSKMWDALMKENRFAPLKDRDAFHGYVESKQIVRYAFTHRNEKKLYNLNTDQRPYYAGSDSITVNFMNRECRTMSSAAAIARKFGMSVTFLRMPVRSRGRYEMEFVTICDDASTMSVEAIMKKYYELLEAEIKQQPWNYLWSHKRWAYL